MGADLSQHKYNIVKFKLYQQELFLLENTFLILH